MALTPEGRVKAAVKKWLQARGIWFCMPMGSMYGADAMRYSIWKDDVISFRDTPLAEVLETLSRWYDVRFETDGQPDRPISYTFATDNTLLDNVLREMELISPVRFERTKTEIKVSFR